MMVSRYCTAHPTQIQCNSREQVHWMPLTHNGSMQAQNQILIVPKDFFEDWRVHFTLFQFRFLGK